MRLKGSSYFLFFILLVALGGIIQSLTYQYFEAKLVPLLASSIVFILMAIELVRDIRSKERIHKQAPEAKAPELPKEPLTSPELRRLAPAMGWVLGFFLIIYLFSFVVAIPVFISTYLRKHGAGWVMTIASAVILLSLIYVVFDFTLQVHLTRGLIVSKIISLLRA